MFRLRSRRDAFVAAVVLALAAPAMGHAGPWSVAVHGGPAAKWTYGEIRHDLGTNPLRIDGHGSFSARVGRELKPGLSLQAGAGWMRFQSREYVVTAAVFPAPPQIQHNADVVPVTLGMRWSPAIGTGPPIAPWIELSPALMFVRWHESGAGAPDGAFIAAAPGFALGTGLKARVDPSLDLETGLRWHRSGHFGPYGLSDGIKKLDGVDQFGWVLGLDWHP